MSDYASVEDVVSTARAAWKPPPRLTLSEWADEYFYLSPGMAAEPGKWKTLPYQRGMMDAITDPAVECVSFLKSARVGGTLIVCAATAYYMHQDPAPILYVLPTVENAEGHSKDTIAPMLRDTPVLAALLVADGPESGPKDSGNTIRHKVFPGGSLMLVGANSGAGLRRVGVRVLVMDEIDAYPPSAGADGDPVELATMRTQAYWNRKIIALGTPLVEGASQIGRRFLEGDGRRYFVPCTGCGHMAPLVFTGEEGHRMTWPEDKPKDAFFTCQANGCVIEHKDKRAMVERGEWRADRPSTPEAPFNGHASFYIWSAYSYADNASWADIAEAFLKAKGNPEKLRTFVNTWLGETWKERGEAPDWERLYQRRESYPLGSVPPGSLVLTAGVDVQKDRFEYEVVSWGAGKESWSVDAGVIPADTSNEAEWSKLDELLARTYPSPDGVMVAIACMAVDSGYNTNVVYSWCRGHALGRVIAVKGVSKARALLGAPVNVDVTVRGVRKARGYKMWPVGVDIAKAELYGWLQLSPPLDGEPYPPGFCHFPQHGEDYFKQLTAEHLVSHVDGRGFTVHEWQLIAGRENHGLDRRVYARAAASLKGLDRMRLTAPAVPPVALTEAQRVLMEQVTALPSKPPTVGDMRPASAAPARPRAAGFLNGGRGGKKWLR